MTKKNSINVSEIFHSIQGEGSTSGKPSVFLRLQACNLMCGGQGTEKDKELHDGATWRCDTIEVWLQGEQWDTEGLAKTLHKRYAAKFLTGSQLVITGGEPMLQQDQFHSLVSNLQGLLNKNIRVEIETNGTIFPLPIIASGTNQFNVSPKLSNSGMPKKRRIKPVAIRELVDLSNANKAIFKFVVTQENDINEILQDYIEPFKIQSKKIWLMPGCSTRDQFEKTAPMVARICKEYGFNFSSRLQINLWNQTTGV